MRKFWLGLVAFVILVLAYQAWPLIGASRLAAAARSGDPQTLVAHVDLPALRAQLTREIVRAYLDRTGRAPQGTLARGLAVDLGTSIAAPYVAQLVTPETLVSLLQKGRVPALAGQPALSTGESLPNFSELLNANAWTVFWSSHFEGFTSYVVEVPGKSPEDRFGVHLHLVSGDWQLSGVDLPKSLVERVVEEIAARQKTG